MKRLATLALAVLMMLSLVLAASAAEFEPGPKLGDKRVRQALLYALDRENFILAEYGSTDVATVGLAPISPTSWAFPDMDDVNPYAFDLDKANALLDEAGWVMGDDGYRYNADGLKLTLNWLVYHDAPWPGTLSAMASDTWKQIGVDLVIELMDFNTVQSRTNAMKPGEKDFDIYTMGFSLDVDPDPTGALFDYNAFIEGGFCNSGLYSERGQELIKLGLQEFDQAKRAEIYKEWALLMNEEVGTSLVAYRREIWGVNNRVKGLDNMNAFVKWDDPGVIESIELEGDQILRFGESSFDGNFNSIITDQVYDSYVVDLVQEGLVKANAQAEYVPLLASWEMSNENRTYTFTLKDGITFSDGTPLTTDDVLFTFMMIAHPDYTGPRLNSVANFVGYKEYAADEADTISGIEVIDEKTIAFTYVTASPANIQDFSYGILPRHYYEADTMEGFMAFINEPMGSGKFVLDDYGPNEFIILSRNENYWDPDNAVKFEGIYWTWVVNENKVPALQMDQIDFAQVNTNLENLEAVQAMEDYYVVSYTANGYTQMTFNTLH